jgi:hypothetical protein
MLAEFHTGLTAGTIIKNKHSGQRLILLKDQNEEGISTMVEIPRLANSPILRGILFADHWEVEPEVTETDLDSARNLF